MGQIANFLDLKIELKKYGMAPCLKSEVEDFKKWLDKDFTFDVMEDPDPEPDYDSLYVLLCIPEPKLVPIEKFVIVRGGKTIAITDEAPSAYAAKDNLCGDGIEIHYVDGSIKMI